MKNLYVDLGANWANTLRLAPDLFPSRGAWLTVAFEASPLIQPFVEQYVSFLNGNRSEPPTVCLPRSGSTIHLRRYAPSLGCGRLSDVTMRACVMAVLRQGLQALQPDPKLNETALVDARLNEATQIADAQCINSTMCQNQYVAVPAAAGIHNGWLSLWGSPEQLIRGGALPTAQAPMSRTHRYTVRSVDVASWLASTALKAEFVFLKMDIVGAEHALLRRMEALGVHRMVHALAIECHGSCIATMRRVRSWNVTIINEERYGGVDSASAAETSVPPSCKMGLRGRRLAVNRIDKCRAAHIPNHAFSTCAVVGSAPSLAYLYQGEEIDAHGAVFRTNAHANVATVGRKTTYRIAANAFQLGKHRKNAENVLQIVPPDRRSLAPGNLVQPDDEVLCVPNVTIDALYSDIGVTFGQHALSTGALAVGLAMRICQSVTIYGFGGLQSFDHVIRDAHHNWPTELLWIRKMLSSKRLVDGTDRGVHERKCELVPILNSVVDLLQHDAFPHMHKQLSMPISNIFNEATGRANEGCAPRSGRTADTSQVDSTLMEVYAKGQG
jgi:hypothetical protein